MAERTIQDLWQMQGLPLSVKVKMTQQRIRDWVHAYGEDGVYVSFSGGKDSTVLLHLVRELYPNVRAVFVDTGLEYPEIRQFVKTFDNVEWLKPKLTFKQVIQKYGYPFISKEVAECVYGARKYLTRVMEQASLEQTDRQTDRQTEPEYRYRFEKLCGLGEFASAKSGGQTASTAKPEESESSVPVRMGETYRDRAIWEAVRTCKIGGCGPARDFANLTGIRTTEGGVDSRLYKGYRQFSNSASNGDSSPDRQSDSEEYP